MRTLVDEVKCYHGDYAASAVRDFFDASTMPVPRYIDFFKSCDSGALVPLEEGCIIRLASLHMSSSRTILEAEKASFVPVLEPEILCPVGIRDLGDLYLEVVPGVDVGITEEEYEELTSTLEDKGCWPSDNAA